MDGTKYYVSIGMVGVFFTFLALVAVKCKKVPRGPHGLPFLGQVTYLTANPHLSISRWRRTFGDIFQIWIGRRPVIVVNGKKLIKEVVVDRATSISGRPACDFSLNDAKVMSHGPFTPSWIKLKIITTSAINSFLRRRQTYIEELIWNETDKLTQKFVTHNGKPVDPREILSCYASRVSYQMCYGRQKDEDSSGDFESLLTSYPGPHWFHVSDYADVPSCLSFILRRQRRRAIEQSQTRNVLDIRRKHVREHKDNFDINNISDMTDELLAAYSSIPETERKTFGLTEDRFMSTLDVINGSARDSVGRFLQWGLLLLARFQSVQDKLYNEICNVVDSGHPCLSKKSDMPYMEATIAEILRFSCLCPMGLPHCSTKETSIGGYCVPASTAVLLNFHSLTHDAAVWGDPEVFQPERFLDKEGQLSRCSLDLFVPFSSGPRRCFGEKMARMQIFLMLTSIVKKFQLLIPDGQSVDLNTVCKSDMVLKPNKVLVKAREQINGQLTREESDDKNLNEVI